MLLPQSHPQVEQSLEQLSVLQSFFNSSLISKPLFFRYLSILADGKENCNDWKIFRENCDIIWRIP